MTDKYLLKEYMSDNNILRSIDLMDIVDKGFAFSENEKLVAGNPSISPDGILSTPLANGDIMGTQLGQPFDQQVADNKIADLGQQAAAVDQLQQGAVAAFTQDQQKLQDKINQANDHFITQSQYQQLVNEFKARGRINDKFGGFGDNSRLISTPRSMRDINFQSTPLDGIQAMNNAWWYQYANFGIKNNRLDTITVVSKTVEISAMNTDNPQKKSNTRLSEVKATLHTGDSTLLVGANMDSDGFSIAKSYISLSSGESIYFESEGPETFKVVYILKDGGVVS